jgi:anti-anti-sigma factor
MSELADVRLYEHDGVTVASIRGEVDVSNAGAIRSALTDLPNLAQGLVVDLGEVRYLDSTGISLLHDLAARLSQRSQRLIVVCPPDTPPRRVIELTGLHVRAPVLDDLALAIESLRLTAGDAPSPQ